MHRKHPVRPTIRLLTDDTVTNPFQENPMPTVQSNSPNLTFTSRGLTVPTVEALVAELALHREARETEDAELEWDAELFFYSRPQVVISTVISADEEEGEQEYGEIIAATFPWDHTTWSLIEAAEIARSLNGRVHVRQEVVTFLVSEDEEEEVEDDGTVFVADGFQVLIADFVSDEARPFIEGDEDESDEGDDDEE
jgi:hypothetical protein